MDKLELENLYLRPFKEEDLQHLYTLHSNKEVAKSTIDGVQDFEAVQKDLQQFISHQAKFGYSQWAVFKKPTDEFVGRAGLVTRTLSEEIGEKTEVRFAFLPQFWGLGFASRITAELIRFSFEDLQMQEIIAANGVLNEKSARVLTKSGFRYVKNILPKGYGTDDEIRYYVISREQFLNLSK